MDHFHPGHALEYLRREMVRAADAGRAVPQGIGLGLGERDELLRILDRHRWMAHHDARHLCEVGDKREVPEQIEVELGIQRRIDCVGDRRHEQRVAIGRRFRRHFSRNIGAGTRAVLDDHLLAPRLVQFLPHRARQHVRRAGRRVTDYVADRLSRVVRRGLGERRRRGERERSGDYPAE
jgi:hypothetical protein